MATASDGFNLLDEPWITVLPAGGKERDVSILELFEQAPRLVAIGGEVPTQSFAITRLLLAFLHRALGGGPMDADEWTDLWLREALPMDEIHKYSDGVRPQFDLFHPTHPFFQVPGLHSGNGQVKGLEKIIADVPNGERLFTTRSMTSVARIDAAEAARWLVHVHAFDPAGIKTGAADDEKAKNGKGYGAPPGWSGQIGGILVEGWNLRETLLFNLIGRTFTKAVQIGRDDDLPPWERVSDEATTGHSVDETETKGKRSVDGPTWEEDCRPDGAIDLYTWQSRRVRLVGDRDGVTGVVLANGDRFPPRNLFREEPHTTWRYSPLQSKKHRTEVYLPEQHKPSRAAWRGLAATLPSVDGQRPHRQRTQPRKPPGVVAWNGHLVNEGKIPNWRPVRVRVVGAMYGAQNAVFSEMVDDTLTMAAVLLSRSERGVALGSAAVDAVDDAENAAKALGWLADNIALAGGATRGSKASERRRKLKAGERAREQLYSALDGPYRTWLAKLGPKTDLLAVRREWQQTVKRACEPVVEELLAAAGPLAKRGREVDGRFVNVSMAESWFYASLRNKLPQAFEPDDATGQESPHDDNNNDG